jgi:hypothetical protein
MADECEMICETCGEQPSTHHVTNMIGGAEATTINLCASCFQKDPSLAALARRPDITDLIRTGKCDYCGDPPVSGSQSSGVGGPDKVHLWCAQCGEDLKEFAARPENQWDAPEIDTSLDNDAFLAELSRLADHCREIEATRQEFMRVKVSQRKPGAN